MPKKDDKETKVIAELEVWADSNPGIAETIKTFDRAWHRLIELPTPAHMRFVKFGRVN